MPILHLPIVIHKAGLLRVQIMFQVRDLGH